MATRLSQEQKTVQRQIATQQTIRLMQLVELPYTSLEQEILKEVDENPALEAFRDEDDEPAYGNEEPNAMSEFDENGDPMELSQDQLSDDEIFKEDYYRDSDLDDYPSEREIENQIQRLNAPDPDKIRDNQGVYYESVQEKLQNQLGEMLISERETTIAQYLLGNLNDDGYFTADLQSVVNELLYMQNLYTNKEEVEHVLVHVIQELDPPGIGARDLRECLLLQLKRSPERSATHDTAKRILEDYFKVFSRRHFEKIAQELHLDEQDLKNAVELIQKLDPHPVDSSTPLDKSAEIINPDFLITSNDGKLTLTLNNQYVPKVRINKEFRNEYRFLTKEASEKRRAEAERFMREYVDRGNQFISTLSTREMILYNTMYAIMQHQKQYFLTGDDAQIKPMILKTIAEEVGIDVSTVSRVSNSKYVQTDFGIIPLKHLFCEAVNDDDVSSKEIKSILSDLISEEDKKHPLSDEKLCSKLNDRGYDIKRRTVAKYRDQLNIPVARLRKSL